MCTKIAKISGLISGFFLQPTHDSKSKNKGKSEPEQQLLRKRSTIRRLILDTLHRFPLAEQHRLTATGSQFFGHCHIPSALVNWFNFSQPEFALNCSAPERIIETITFEHKCYSLLANREISIEDDDSSRRVLRDVARNFEYLLSVQINRRFLSGGFIRIHSPQISHQYTPTSGTWPLETDRHQRVEFAYDTTIMQMLPAPYGTDCHDYRIGGYQCRDDCMARCKIARYLANTATGDSGWPGDVPAEPNITWPISRLWIDAHVSSSALPEAGISGTSLATCTLECGLWSDCERTIFAIRPTRVVERAALATPTRHTVTEEDMTYTIRILAPRDAPLVVRHVPKFEPIQLWIYIGSLAHFYLGFSVISTLAFAVACATFATPFQERVFCRRWVANYHRRFGGRDRGRDPRSSKNAKINRKKQRLPKPDHHHHINCIDAKSQMIISNLIIDKRLASRSSMIEGDDDDDKSRSSLWELSVPTLSSNLSSSSSSSASSAMITLPVSQLPALPNLKSKQTIV